MSEKKPFVSSQEHRINPNCAIRYEVDYDGNITDIVADGNQEEAEAMAIHFLAKRCRRGEGNLGTYFLMLGTYANAKENPSIEIVLHGSLPPKMEDVIKTELPGIQVLCDCNNAAEIKLMIATTLNQLADNIGADLLDLSGEIMTVALMMRRTPKSVVDMTELLKQRRGQNG